MQGHYGEHLQIAIRLNPPYQPSLYPYGFEADSTSLGNAPALLREKYPALSTDGNRGKECLG